MLCIGMLAMSSGGSRAEVEPSVRELEEQVFGRGNYLIGRARADVVSELRQIGSSVRLDRAKVLLAAPTDEAFIRFKVGLLRSVEMQKRIADWMIEMDDKYGIFEESGK